MSKEELKQFKILAKDILLLEKNELEKAIANNIFVEIGEENER